MSASVPAGAAREPSVVAVDALAATRANLAALTDARGVPELEALLVRAEGDCAQAHAALRTAADATHSLSAFHAALFHLRAVLEPVREALADYEEDADALLWAHATTNDAVQPVLALLRTYRRAVNDLLFALPGHPPSPAPRRRPPR